MIPKSGKLDILLIAELWFPTVGKENDFILIQVSFFKIISVFASNLLPDLLRVFRRHAMFGILGRFETLDSPALKKAKIVAESRWKSDANLTHISMTDSITPPFSHSSNGLWAPIQLMPPMSVGLNKANTNQLYDQHLTSNHHPCRKNQSRRQHKSRRILSYLTPSRSTDMQW